LFDDDGETFAFERGHYRWRALEALVAPGGRKEGVMSAAPVDWRSAFGEPTWVFLPQKPVSPQAIPPDATKPDGE
jgi:alpha-D-xyloside xylohydrolase